MFTLIALLVGAVAISMGVFVIVKGQRNRSSAQQFIRQGVFTQALVLELRSREWDMPRAGGISDKRVWFPFVQFELPDGRIQKGESLTGGKPAPAKVGDLAPIVYDPQSPDRLMVTRGMAQQGLVGTFYVALGCGFIGIGLLAFAFWALIKLVLKVPV